MPDKVSRPSENLPDHSDFAVWADEWRDYALELETRAKALADAVENDWQVRFSGASLQDRNQSQRIVDNAQKALYELMEGK